MAKATCLATLMAILFSCIIGISVSYESDAEDDQLRNLYYDLIFGR